MTTILANKTVLVGGIGLEKMGQPKTRNLHKKGFSVVVFSRSSGGSDFGAVVKLARVAAN